MINYKSLLHRYIHHVGRVEGATFIPEEVLDRDWFTDEEMAELATLDQEPPPPLTSNPG